MRFARPRRLAGAALAVVLLSVAIAVASESGLSGTQGHPRGRLPLTLHLGTTHDTGLDLAAHRAVFDWNAVAQETLGTPAFRLAAGKTGADVVVTFEPGTAEKLMGQAYLNADGRGLITLPVRIEIFQPSARGQTTRDIVLYQVLAHELGHALGLPHVRDPRSLMCCVKGSVDFNDPAQREAYLQGRRHPEVRTVRTELAKHYDEFWKGAPAR